MMLQGRFITFEGLDGSGKSTHAQLTADYLETLGCEVVLTREPGGTPLAEEIRRIILTPTVEKLAPPTEILLYAAARAQHVSEVIKPALAAGKVVICDRFIDSNIVYQGYGLGYGPEQIRQVNQLAVDGLNPDLTFFIDVDTQEALGRIKARPSSQPTGDRIELRAFSFHQRVRDGYLKLAENEERIIRIIAATRSVDMIQEELIRVLHDRYNL